MNHPAELQVFSYLQKAMKGEATMTEEVANQVASDVKVALDKQFNSPPPVSYTHLRAHET